MYQRRYNPLDISNICVVRGRGGLLLVDTRSSPRQADEVRSPCELGGDPVVAVVNTHATSTTPSATRSSPGSRSTAISGCQHTWPRTRHRCSPSGWPVGKSPSRSGPRWRSLRRQCWSGRSSASWWATGSSILLHLGRGHTDNDIVLHVPDASAWIVGDLVEESGPPMYGSGCFPLEWPGTSAALANRLGQADVVVPGHGQPVTRPFVEAQQAQLAAVADLITELHAAGVPRNGRATRARAAGPCHPRGDQAISAGRSSCRRTLVVPRARSGEPAPGPQLLAEAGLRPQLWVNAALVAVELPDLVHVSDHVGRGRDGGAESRCAGGPVDEGGRSAGSLTAQCARSPTSSTRPSCGFPPPRG